MLFSVPESTLGMTAELSRASVLVVEDEPLILEVVADELSDAGFDVIQASSGEEAAAILAAQSSLDLLLTDIRLPGGIDGWGVAEHARQRFADVPVIYVTGYSGTPARQVPGSVLIMKPYRPAAIVKAAQDLGLRPTPRE